MLNNPTIENLSNKFRDLINSSPAGDVENNLRALLQGALTKMELVTREEFDIQQEVLRQTRAKLDALEARVAELEQPATQENAL
ncbi:accessory factor UbiK family protein [Pseudomethylobacillus aquaticus]|uniref:Ubiquinone biosynthesis accessory factor UbiK n=1 Tax=Pseudomethylobacillus aquaticus TaxID=2676064 RepID=A0A3N0V348_9PROT|nr:accessory factor UbiK family protein [Pseudomethylobacillus aquaticus]ROH86974.1 accessory factor UbiK family protein [Pseudomethylobacillus aquaticus]